MHKTPQPEPSVGPPNRLPKRRRPAYAAALFIVVVVLLVLVVFRGRLTEDKSLAVPLPDGPIVIVLSRSEAIREVQQAIAEMTTLFDQETIKSYHTLRQLGIDTDDEVTELKGRLLARPHFKGTTNVRKPNALAARMALRFRAGSTVKDAAEGLRTAVRAAW